MSKQIDHRKASKAAKVSKQGAEFIESGDRTLSASGYPSAQDMARSPPKRRRPRIIEGPPRIYTQETPKEFIANVLRGEREKEEAKKNLKTRREKSAVTSEKTEKTRNTAQVSRRETARQSRTPPQPPASIGGIASKSAARPSSPLLVVVRKQPRSLGSRQVQVEFKRLSPLSRAKADKDQSQKR